MRIVTLLPSATEIVYALGLEPVAVSHECDYPPAARGKPAVERSRVDAEASTAEIDAQVREAEADDGVYAIDDDALATANPDFVVTQGVCDVCAVDEVAVERAVEELDLDCEILTTDPHSIDDVFEDVSRVAAATGTEARAEELLSDLRGRVGRVRDRMTDLPVEERPRTAVFDWTDPVMVAGHWVPETVELAGGEYGMAEAGAASTPREWADVREYDPEAVVVAPCGFDLDQTRKNATDLTDRPGWDDLTAIKEDRVFAVDGNAYFNRPGPRLVDSLEILAGLLHPDRFERPDRTAARPFSELTPSRRAD
jgi:iron complex transport system substrate-binding protein